MTMRIALTGGIAEGKTTVLRMVAEAGIPTLQADLVAREVLERPDVQQRIAADFDLPLPIDRVLLRDRISDPQARRHLNRLLHPSVIQMYESFPYGVVEIPLLLETAGQGRFDAIWVATCGRELQVQRLAERVGSVPLAIQLLATQLDSRTKCAFADTIVRTDQPLDLVSQSVREQCRLFFPC